MSYIKLDYIEVTQKIGTFYVAKITPADLRLIANDNLSRYKNAEDGIQRNINQIKSKEIREYIKNDEIATFPNSIVVALRSDHSEEDPDYYFNDEEKSLYIRKDSKVANIIDGQHRLSGFDSDEISFELIISIFLDLSLGQQARVFAKINSTQSKVSLDLVYDLFGITDERTPEKIAYFIVKHLNEDEDSSWQNQIKTLYYRDGFLAQGSMAKYIDKQLISKNKPLFYLYEQEKEANILAILKSYFKALSETFQNDWNDQIDKSVIKKTTGFVGAMNFFKDLHQLAKVKQLKVNYEFFKEILSRFDAKHEGFVSNIYVSGAVGQNLFRDTLRRCLTDEEKEIIGIK